jgi:hypothetical protein
MEDGKNRGPGKIMGETALEAGEIDGVLARASVPPMLEGAMPRLLARIAAEPQEPQEAKVLLFRPAAISSPRHSLARYAAALPLAASLALGVYFGARGTLDFMLPAAITGVAQNEEPIDDLGGVGEADDYATESLS